jgi:hypothetical protein
MMALSAGSGPHPGIPEEDVLAINSAGTHRDWNLRVSSKFFDAKGV